LDAAIRTRLARTRLPPQLLAAFDRPAVHPPGGMGGAGSPNSRLPGFAPVAPRVEGRAVRASPVGHAGCARRSCRAQVGAPGVRARGSVRSNGRATSAGLASARRRTSCRLRARRPVGSCHGSGATAPSPRRRRIVGGPSPGLRQPQRGEPPRIERHADVFAERQHQLEALRQLRHRLQPHGQGGPTAEHDVLVLGDDAEIGSLGRAPPSRFDLDVGAVLRQQQPHDAVGRGPAVPPSTPGAATPCMRRSVAPRHRARGPRRGSRRRASRTP
jgi:hypothetical protein